MAALAASAGGPLDRLMGEAIEDGTASAALLRALGTGPDALLDAIVRTATSGHAAAMTEISLVLVAELDGAVVGSLHALPPGAVIAQLAAQGVDVLEALTAASAIGKVKSLAVAPQARGRGIATALLSGCVRIYDQLDFVLLYGSFAVGSGLGDFYRARGFEIVAPGHGIPLQSVLGLPAALGSEEGEQLFVRWRP